MKTNIFYLILVSIIFFTSCKKETITPGQYGIVDTPPDTSHWQDDYGNGGTLPTWDTITTHNQAYGTNWVLIDVYANYAHVAKNDTIHFISDTKYTVGSNPTQYTYSLSSTMGNSTLQLNTFIPINGLTLNCSNFWANAFTTTPVSGTIQLLLKDVFTTTTYASTFKKI